MNFKYKLFLMFIFFNLCKASEPIGKDMLLIINYNHPHYDSIPFLQELYSPFFPHIVFVGPSAHEKVELCDHENGYYAYKALASIMRKHPHYKGYLWMNDDCVINPWNFTRFDKSKIWCVPSRVISLDPTKKQAWALWKKPFGYEATKNAYAKLSKKHKAMLAKSCGENAVLVALSEVVYIPAQYRKQTIELSKLFAYEKSFVEIALPTICGCLTERKNWQKIEGVWLLKDPNPLSKYTHQIDYLHPVKFSLKNNRNFIFDQFKGRQIDS